MFDERQIQLAYSYAKINEYFLRNIVYPLLDWASEKLIQKIGNELDKRLKLELGESTYVMRPDENGGWKWTKFDRETNDFIDAEFSEQQSVEELLTEFLIPLLPAGNTPPLLPGSTPPPDLPPGDSPLVVSPCGNPPFLPTSATPVEVIAIQHSPFSTESGRSQDSRGSEEVAINNPADSSTPPFDPVPPISRASPAPCASPAVDASSPDPLSTVSINDMVPTHWQELVEGSTIHPEIARRNFTSLHQTREWEHEAWEYLMYSDRLPRNNTGRLSSAIISKYTHIESGGWWCDAGVNPLSFANQEPGEQPDRKLWGCYKPDNPREKADKPGKFIKYEHPPKTELSIFLLDVPDDIAHKIYDKAGVNPSQSDRVTGFWYCVWKHNVPVTITEGAKKAACLLSQGEAAIGLPGIYAGYRSKDELGNPIAPTLHPELAVFAIKDRHIKICFDYETKIKTKRNINIATYRTGQLLEASGAKVNVVSLPGPQKGVDDLIVAQGAEAFISVEAASVPLDEWWQNNQPPDLRLVVFLKNGEELRLYEQKGDGTVKDYTADLLPEEETVSVLPKPRGKLAVLDPDDITPTIKVIDAEIIPESTNVVSNQSSPVHLEEAQDNPIHSDYSWAKKEEVTLYKQTWPRQRLEARENKEIALAALALVKKYGVQQNNQDNSVYQADAFTIKKSGGNYSICRRHDNKELMKFQADRSATPTIWIVEKPKDMLPIERQEFLLVADYLKNKQLPSPDEDPRKIANALGSLSLDGTHKILESFKQKEVFQILVHTLKTFGRDDLTLGNYRILYQKSQQDSTSHLKLLKTEHNGITRVAASFELNRTQQGMIHQVRTLALSELDLNKLRLLAQKLDMTPSIATQASVNPHATRDIEVPVHPQIVKHIQHLEQPLQPQNQTQNEKPVPKTEQPKRRQSNFPSPHNQSSKSKSDSVILPLHPEIARHWQDLENTERWVGLAQQGSNEFRSQIQNTAGLTISEQRELYFVLQLQAQAEIRAHGVTDIILSPLNEIVKDLRQQSPLNNQVDSYEQERNTELPLHPQIARHWQDLEINKTWVTVADQWNYPLRQKLKQTGKLTIGEQRELYQKLLVQSSVEQNRYQKTEISLPPLGEILQDLMNEREKVIDNTYSPKVEVCPQKSKQQQQNGKSVEFEL
ncbi:hypothetical protein A6770_37005 [Nostoc minutum NIES-26]|uniref:DUF3854 domain-containing protein n=1 Tax=Nostoc minutum NIES-26 TaxID=1844469 RepID=A0A367RYY0_9NOSO|nr:hypothetical protein A6770_37005 [Nostoc minutum NIES-26]